MKSLHALFKSTAIHHSQPATTRNSVVPSATAVASRAPSVRRSIQTESRTKLTLRDHLLLMLP